MTAGQRFREALAQNQPLQIVGTINAYQALQATKVGHKALYLSGAGVANASYGLPDLGMTNLEEVCIDVRRICAICPTPLIVDADTGFGHALNIGRCVSQLIRNGAAGMHLEDQVGAKRCGHRPNKEIVETQEMCDRLHAALEARKIDPSFYLIARTDARAKEGLESAIERALSYAKTGIDAIFAEALQSLEEYHAFSQALSVPLLANITEFGLTPMFGLEELKNVGVAMVLYPLSAFRAMNKAALSVYADLKHKGTQKDQIPYMQTREELYEMLGYYDYEAQIDRLLGRKS
ncbi:methylisocitrate lyase [Helicobacter bizzozeronii]|uniref:methylisocitrate lyase n=1 Tax=Helicobacter bizzozeronii TaxID=56877 RepID=UPI000CEF1D6E|nr:methylisocitrate lyase [Helicobacter bizzozeronii]GMT38539.1 methylisocitrate lyase [Helicobacter bizzozeronii]